MADKYCKYEGHRAKVYRNYTYIRFWQCLDCMSKRNKTDKGRSQVRAAIKKYEQSEKGKAAILRYQKSEKGKAKAIRRGASESGKAAVRRFSNSERGKLTRLLYRVEKRDNLRSITG